MAVASNQRSCTHSPPRHLHADIALHKFLLGDDGRIMLCEFAGSIIDGCNSSVAPGVRYYNPLFRWEYPNTKDDIFSLGTVLYDLNRGERLFHDLESAEIIQRFQQKRFPDLNDVPTALRDVIERCWTQDGITASDALRT